jgi:UDP-2-acetamido-2,6-beta-L-arabino-hexul-4-ose reductase
MKVLVTGANGFIAKNLIVRLQEKKFDVVRFSKGDCLENLNGLIKDLDFIFHLAGVNRSDDILEFGRVNFELTKELCRLVKLGRYKIPILYTSSIHAGSDCPYGISKLQAEKELTSLAEENQSPVYIYRLPNIFGKWSRPNYNSVVATFCYNVINDIPLKINDASLCINLIYIDDLIDDFFRMFFLKSDGLEWPIVRLNYELTVGELAKLIQSFKIDRSVNYIGPVGNGLIRSLYSTYLSFYEPPQFSYQLDEHTDARGRFVEILKTKEFGQFSFFTAHPGITRGGHYHHTKNEKFLVVKGAARFRFRHVVTDEVYDLLVEEKNPVIVETIPGWSHDITNVSDTEMIVFIWANEVYDKDRPDTFSYEVLL